MWPLNDWSCKRKLRFDPQSESAARKRGIRQNLRDRTRSIRCKDRPVAARYGTDLFFDWCGHDHLMSCLRNASTGTDTVSALCAVAAKRDGQHKDFLLSLSTTARAPYRGSPSATRKCASGTASINLLMKSTFNGKCVQNLCNLMLTNIQITSVGGYAKGARA